MLRSEDGVPPTHLLRTELSYPRDQKFKQDGLFELQAQPHIRVDNVSKLKYMIRGTHFNCSYRKRWAIITCTSQYKHVTFQLGDQTIIIEHNLIRRNNTVTEGILVSEDRGRSRTT